MARMTSACVSLTTLKLMMATGRDEANDELGAEASQCRDLMRTGVLRSFLEKLSNLQNLEVQFDVSDGPDECFPARLQDVIGDNHVWPSLKKLSLAHLDDASETQVLDILRRHGGLRRLIIDTMMLVPGDSWLSLLPKIRDVVPLDRACVCGSICTADRTEAWYIDPLDASSRDEFREKLGDFIVRGGECPLNRENMDFR